MVSVVDLTGTKCGSVSVIERAASKNGKATWKCQCACGSEFVAVGSSLRMGRVKGCPACAKSHAMASITKHGATGTPEYVSYNAMKQRCYYPKNKRYERYGGRGVKVCNRWLESFDNFISDMGQMPSPGMSIERLDTDGDYEPSNCIWATRTEQANNRSNNTPIEIDGCTKNLTQWSREYGVNRTVIMRRLQRGITGKALIQKRGHHD